MKLFEISDHSVEDIRTVISKVGAQGEEATDSLNNEVRELFQDFTEVHKSNNESPESSETEEERGS